MKIVLATPLYPPDIAEPAPYIKELATRLSREHTVHIVTYGRYVEPVEGVRTTAIDKQGLLPIRLLQFVHALKQAMDGADLIYVENGPSVELPLLLLSFTTSFRYTLHLGDAHALKRTHNNTGLRFLNSLARHRAERVIERLPLVRPELIPFQPRLTQEFERYEKEWVDHIQSLNLHHA